MERKSWVVLVVIFGGLFVTLFGFLFLAYVAVNAEEEGTSFGTGQAVGVIQIEGVIQSADETLKQLKRFKDDDDVKALLVRINSPGGAVAPSQEIRSELRTIAKDKPVVCSFGDLAASGGYYIATGCQKIVSSPGTLTGSIGVISQQTYLGDVANALRFKVITIKSGKLKDVGNPFREMTEAERAYFQGLLDSVHEQFIEAVAEGRGMKVEEVRPWADGRILTGQQAKEAKLVDELGNLHEAAKLAASLAGIEDEPRLKYPPEEKKFPFDRLLEEGGRALARGVRRELGVAAGGSELVGPAYLAPNLVAP